MHTAIRHRDPWQAISAGYARVILRRAVRPLRRSRGGPFTNREIEEILGDLIDIPAKEFDFEELTKEQCRVLIIRLLLRGLI